MINDELNKEKISWCENNLIPLYNDSLSYALNENGEIIIYGDVIFVSDFKEVPYKIHEVYGSFVTDNTIDKIDGNLQSLKNMPDIVHGKFDISHNKHVTSLKGGPNFVEGTYWCNSCSLSNLNGVAKYIKGSLCAYLNNIKNISILNEIYVGDEIDIDTAFENEINKLQKK